MSESIALRVHTRKIVSRRARRLTNKQAQTETKPWYEDWPQLVAVLDCETTTDETQGLSFGAMRVYSGKQIVFETLFYGLQASDADIQALKAYANTHREGDIEGSKGLALARLEVLDYHRFINLLLRVLYSYSGVLVGFNVPFDISRLALGYYPPKKGYYTNGFIFHFNEYIRKGKKKTGLYKPRLAFKSLGEGRSLTSIYHPVRNRKKERGGYVVDLHTMSYALTETKHTLQSACQEFDTQHGKIETQEFGVITPDYINYCRSDVLATWELYSRLLDEYRRHPIPTTPNRLFSSASLGKGYLKAIGVRLPPLEVDPDLGISADEVIGLAMSAYYGGRSETRIRKTIVPVSYLDFLSMYPTVNILLSLWEMLTSNKVNVQDGTDEVRQFVDGLTFEDLYNQKTWRKMSALVRIKPDGDFLPVRPAGKDNENYGIYSVDWRFVNSSLEGGLWYALPDVIASKFLTGKMPEIIQAIRFVPVDRQDGLRPVLLRGTVNVDPYKDDFFKKVIEERKRLAGDKSMSAIERLRHERALKYIADGAGYGIYVELNRNDSSNGKADVQVYSKDTFRATANWLEEPGAFYYPPLAVLITSAAHLMLAMLEYEVNRRAGSYVFMDTDSMAIVSTVDGGSLDIKDDKGDPAHIVALPRDEIMQIVTGFERLNPYNHHCVSETLLKIEPENKLLAKDEKALSYTPGEQPVYITSKDLPQGDLPLYCYSISSKRYALFNRVNGCFVLRKFSQAILGQFMSPFGETDKTREWLKHYWLWEVSGQTREYQSIFAQSPVITPFTITTAALVRAFEKYNRKRSYPDTIKPFNFLIHPLLAKDLDRQAKPEQDTKPDILVAAYAGDAYKALKLNYININDPGQTCRIVMEAFPGTIDNSAIDWDTRKHPTYVARSMADYLFSYSFHPEGGMVDGRGEYCKTRTKGLLYPTSIEVGAAQYIGKETNLFDQWVSGVVTPGEETLMIYQPDEWENEILPHLKEIPIYELSRATCIDQGNLTMFLSGKRRPNEENIENIKQGLLKVNGCNEWMDKILPCLKKMSTCEVVKLTGLSHSQVCLLKSGKGNPSVETVKKLKAVMNITGLSRSHAKPLKNGKCYLSNDVLEKVEREGERKSTTPPRSRGGFPGEGSPVCAKKTPLFVQFAVDDNPECTHTI